MAKPLFAERVTTEYPGKGGLLCGNDGSIDAVTGPVEARGRVRLNAGTRGVVDIGPGGCPVDGIGGPGPGERVQVSVTIQHRSVALVGTLIYTDRVMAREGGRLR